MKIVEKVRPLFDTSLATVVDYRCTGPEVGVARGDFTMPRHVLCFPRRGVFYRHERGRHELGDPNQVLFFDPAITFQISYPIADGDDSTMFGVSSDVVREAVGVFDPGAGEAEVARFGVSVHPSSPSLYMLHHALFDHLASSESVDLLAMEEGITHLVTEAVGSAYQDWGAEAPAVRAATEKAHRELAENTKSLLGARFTESITLADLARAVGSSPFHLCRVFRRIEGMTIHCYLTRLRLRAALERIAEAPVLLTDLALELGFSSHAHFTGAFRKEFGVSPSDVRNSAPIMQILRFLRKA